MIARLLISVSALALSVLAAAPLAQETVPMDADAAMHESRSSERADAESRERFRALDSDVQDLKSEVLNLNRDLLLLEEDLLFPAKSQVAFFVSMDVGEYFKLDAISLTIDGKEVVTYLYTEREVGALLRGGIHRVHMANLKAGEHELIAIFTGRGPHAREYRRGATMNLEKGIGTKYVELEISDRLKKQQPDFIVREWE